jgi:hypothetical protein
LTRRKVRDGATSRPFPAVAPRPAKFAPHWRGG